MRLHWHRRDFRVADDLGLAAPDYPEPIVDHGERRERAVEMFEQARGGN